MKILSNSNNTSFGAKFSACSKEGKEGIRKAYDSHIRCMQNSKQSALKTYDCLTKDPDIQAKLERLPEKDEVVLSANEYGLSEDGGALEIYPTKLFYASGHLNSAKRKDPGICCLEIPYHDPQSIKEMIGNWLDKLYNLLDK